MDRLNDALRWGWGYPSLRPPQRLAIETVLSGRDALVVLPTGGGKSICYQLPALLGDGPVLVVSPLIALMEDQVQAARQAVSAAALHSEQPGSMQWQIVQDYMAGHIRLLYTSPERLVQTKLIEDLKGNPPTLVAVDEAHCISTWGHDFRPEYRQLAALLRNLSCPRMALTATATPKVAEDIARQLDLRQPEQIRAPVYRSNLTFRAQARHDLKAQLRQLLGERRGMCGIVYCRKRKQAEELAAYFADQDINCAPFHAGLPSEVKRETLQRFLGDQLDVVFATVAFGMGIDRPDVRFVIHAASPDSLEAYVQEAGRAGRDGLPADCILLFGQDEVGLAYFFINKENPPPDRRRSLEQALKRMGQFARTPRCRHRQISEHFGQSIEGGDCGTSCDVCRGETEVIQTNDAAIVARVATGLVAELGGRFGRGHLAGVLAGSKAERILKWRHQNSGFYGALNSYGEKGVIELIDQLMTHEVLITGEHNGYPVVQLGPVAATNCPPLSKPLTLRARSRSKLRTKVSMSGIEQQIFERLRDWRRELAQSWGKPAYVVASDRSLTHLAKIRPTTVGELTAIHGFGVKKVESLQGELLPLMETIVAEIDNGRVE